MLQDSSIGFVDETQTLKIFLKGYFLNVFL